MKGYIFALTAVLLVCNVSATWKHDTLERYVSMLESYVNAEKETRQAEQKRRGYGERCIDIENIRFDHITKEYRNKIWHCINDAYNQAMADSCADYMVAETLRDFDRIVLEAKRCFNQAV